MEQATKADTTLHYLVQIQDAKGQPTAASTPTKIEIQLMGATGDVAKTDTCDVLAHTAQAECSLQAPASGLYKIKSHPCQPNHTGGNRLLARPPRQDE